MQVRHIINVQVSDDAEMLDILFGLSDEKAEVKTSAFSKYTAGRFSILASANEDLAFGDVGTVRGFYIKTDGEFSLKMNGAATGITFTPAATGGTARVAGEATLTSLNVANPSATAVLSGIWMVYGDPT